MNAIHKVAAVIVVLGAIVLAGPMFGFSSITADRNVNATVSDDKTALLAVNETYDGDPIDTQRGSIRDTAEVAELENNADQTFTDVDIDVTNIEGDSDTVLEVAEQPDRLDVDDDPQPVEVGCSGIEESSGVANITLTYNVGSDSLKITEMKRTVVDFDYTCQDEGELPEAEKLVYVDGSAQTSDPGHSSDLEFTIENTGDESVVLESFSVARTINQPRELDNEQNAEVLVKPVSGESGSFDGNKYQIMEVGNENVEPFDVAPRIDPGSEATITMETFREQNGDPYPFDEIDEEGNDLVITVTTADGKEAAFEFGV